MGFFVISFFFRARVLDYVAFGEHAEEFTFS